MGDRNKTCTHITKDGKCKSDGNVRRKQDLLRLLCLHQEELINAIV